MKDIKEESFPIKSLLYRVEKVRDFSGGMMSVTWNWEISIADRGVHYYGMAVERSRNETISWSELTGMHPDTEMKEKCKKTNGNLSAQVVLFLLLQNKHKCVGGGGCER